MFSSNQHVLKFHLLNEILFWSLTSWFIARFHCFVILFLILLILLTVPFIWGTSAIFLLCLDRWTWRKKKGELKRWKTDYKRKKIMANFDPLDVHGMIVWNDRLLRHLNDHLLKRRKCVLILIDCFYFWDFSLKLHVLPTIWRWFLIEMLMTDAFFKKNLIKWMCMEADQRSPMT